jgi:serine/threonine protein kinase
VLIWPWTRHTERASSAEVDSAKKVASFCTAGVLDHGEDAGMLYMVTEFIEGVALDAYVHERRPLQASVLHATAVGVAAALTAIHAVGLIHRDLKPSNVLLSMGGPRVIDFGIARSTETGSGHTQAGFMIDSAGWMAPELFDDHISPAADVFAWGCMIAYAALGRHPFGEGDAVVMAARMRHAQPDLSDLAAPLDRLVAAALNPQPERRPSARQGRPERRFGPAGRRRTVPVHRECGGLHAGRACDGRTHLPDQCQGHQRRRAEPDVRSATAEGPQRRAGRVPREKAAGQGGNRNRRPKLDPGESFTGALIFEVPGNFRPATVELHDSALSRGTRLRLSR